MLKSMIYTRKYPVCSILSLIDLLAFKNNFDHFYFILVVFFIVFKTGPDREVGPWKLGTGMKTSFFKPKEPDFLLIPRTAKTGVGPHEPVRTVRSNPNIFFFFTILFYLIKLSISYKELKKIIIKILQRYSNLLQKLIINFNVFMVIILFY